MYAILGFFLVVCNLIDRVYHINLDFKWSYFRNMMVYLRHSRFNKIWNKLKKASSHDKVSVFQPPINKICVKVLIVKRALITCRCYFMFTEVLCVYFNFISVRVMRKIFGKINLFAAAVRRNIHPFSCPYPSIWCILPTDIRSWFNTIPVTIQLPLTIIHLAAWLRWNTVIIEHIPLHPILC